MVEFPIQKKISLSSENPETMHPNVRVKRGLNDQNEIQTLLVVHCRLNAGVYARSAESGKKKLSCSHAGGRRGEETEGEEIATKKEAG